MIRTLLFLIVGSLCAHAQKGVNIYKDNTLLFVENKGQIADEHGDVQEDILFTLKDKNGVTVYFNEDGLTYQWNTQIESANISSISEATGYPAENNHTTNIQSYRVDMSWENASKNVSVIPQEPTNGNANFYLAHCSKGIHNVKSYKKLVYSNIYPGIDVEYYINKAGHLKYDVIIHPGADPSLLSYSYRGAVPILTDGKVRINTPLGYLEEQVPVAWIKGSENEKVNVEYRKTKHGVGFKISKEENTIILDPEIIWGTYYGGPGTDAAYSTKVDASGNVFLAGETTSTASIAVAPGCITTKSTSADAFIVKFNSDGTTRAWATYYGGTGSEGAKSMALDATGNVYIVGSTSTNSGGLPNTTYQTSFGGGGTDAFLAKFDNSGGCMWATYYGTNQNQRGEDVAVDGEGNVYIAGYTDGGIPDIDNSPTGHDKSYSNPQIDYRDDAFLIKFNSTGTTRLWATYYGGEYDEEAYAVYVDPQNNVYLAGEAGSSPGDQQTDIATSGAYKNTKTTSKDGFVVKFDAAGTRQWGTYFGGIGDDGISAISQDQLGNLYLVGSTSSSTDLGTTTESYQQTKGTGSNKDAFIAKLSGNGSSLLWASYFGGNGNDFGNSITLDKSGHAFLVGHAASSGLAFKGFQNGNLGGSAPDVSDTFVVMFSIDGKSILWSSYYGGTGNDYAYSIAKNESGVYVAGKTASAAGLSKDGFQLTKAAGDDAFLVKIEIPEIIEETFPSLAEKSGTTPVSVKLNTVGGSTVKFWSRGISATKDVWKSETITPTGTTFTKNLSADDLTDPIGILYYFEVTDISQANYQSTSSKAHLHYSQGDNTLTSLRFGSAVSDYQIIAAPLVLDNKAITVALDELGSYNIKRWRLFRYENANVEYPAFSNLEPGLGYWLIIKNQLTIDPGAGQTVPVDDDNPFSIELKTGWNLIGNPYNFRISWSDVLSENGNPTGVDDQLSIFSGGQLTESDVLDKYRGAFVFSDANITLEIPVLRNISLGGRKGSPSAARNPIDQNEWSVPLRVSYQKLVNDIAAIGMHPEATLTGKDSYDKVNVPMLEGVGFFELQVDHPEVHATFSKDFVPSQDEYTWNLNVRRDDPVPLEITWDNTSFGENDKQLYLLNPMTLQAVNMRNTNKLTVGADASKLLLIYGSQSYVDDVLDLKLPGLGNPYPLPSHGKVYIPIRIPKSNEVPHVKVDIFDSKGMVVSNLVDDFVSSGQYTVEWESKYAGLFFVQLRMNDQTITRKLIIH